MLPIAEDDFQAQRFFLHVKIEAGCAFLRQVFLQKPLLVFNSHQFSDFRQHIAAEGGQVFQGKTHRLLPLLQQRVHLVPKGRAAPLEGILAQGVQVLSAAEETVIAGRFDFQQNTVPLLFHPDTHLGVFPEEPEIVSPLGFQRFSLQKVKPPVEGIAGKSDPVFLIAGFIPGMEGAAHGTE